MVGMDYGLGPATAGKTTASLTLLLSVFGGLQDQPLTNKVHESEDNCSNLPTLQWISSGMCSTRFLWAPQWCWTPAVQRGSLLINAHVQLSSFSFVLCPVHPSSFLWWPAQQPRVQRFSQDLLLGEPRQRQRALTVSLPIYIYLLFAMKKILLRK